MKFFNRKDSNGHREGIGADHHRAPDGTSDDADGGTCPTIKPVTLDLTFDTFTSLGGSFFGTGSSPSLKKPAEPEPDIVIPDRIEPVVGYKAFSLCLLPLVLSPSYHAVWDDQGMMTATCSKSSELIWFVGSGGPSLPCQSSPGPKCACGIYATSDIKDLMRYMKESVGILGTVKAWGKVIEGTTGFRAEKAQITSFWVPPLIPDHLRANLNLYAAKIDVPVFEPEDFYTFTAESGVS